MRKLLTLICLALSACNTPPPERQLSLKEIKFPDLEFSRFIAENGIRRTEQNDSTRFNIAMTSQYDSLGRLTERSNSFAPFHSAFKYDTNGLIMEKIESGCLGDERSISRFHRPKRNMLYEDEYILIHNRNNRSDTELLWSRKAYLLDKQNRVTMTGQYFPVLNMSVNCLLIELFKYDTANRLSYFQHWETALPLLPLRKSEGAIYEDAHYYYTGNKPDSIVRSRLFTKRSFSKPIGVKEISSYDERGLLKTTVIDDTLIFGYQHYKVSSDSLKKEFIPAVRMF